MRLTRLRLAGFKSFVDPCELSVEDGLTGVVGPNGCGKSNLVEALRWVMGEGSARRVRGDGMEDVIFAGTAARPARNLAEVRLSLDNADRRAPAALNDAAELEVSRRIERGRGSSYRVNGREARARDVQLLFADAGTGARASGIVGQGRIGEIINAQPGERRALLEEAAGVRGLQARRQETETRLRAAEQNLARLEDVLQALQERLDRLRRQARQAARYRAVAERIRRAESVLLHRRWQAALAGRDHAAEACRAAEAASAETAAAAARQSARQAELAAGLPALRQAETRSAAALQRLTLARGALDAEERRIAAALGEAETRLRQIADDIDRETALAGEAEAAAARLAAEDGALRAAQAGEAETVAAAEARLQQAAQTAETAEAAVSALTERIAVTGARHAALERQHRQAADRIARLRRQCESLADQQRRLAAETVSAAALAGAEAAVTAAEAELAAARQQAGAAETAAGTAREHEEAARCRLQGIEAAIAGLSAEAEALARLETGANGAGAAPVLDDVTVRDGHEAALAAGFGDSLSAPARPAAPAGPDGEAEASAGAWWGAPGVGALPAPLPAGAEPLSGMVEAPAVLHRRLAAIGVVADEAAGWRLCGRLAPGQRLVTREGGLWRWDGFVRAPGGPMPAEARLRQRARQRELDARLQCRRSAQAAAASVLAEAGAEHAARRRAAAEAGARIDAAFKAMDRARDARAALAARAVADRSRAATLESAIARAGEDLADSEAQRAAAREEQAGLAAIDALRAEAADRRRELAGARASLAEARGGHDRLIAERAGRRGRLAALAEEARGWRGRGERAAARLRQLAARRREAEAERDRQSARPAEIGAERDRLAALIAAAEDRRRGDADALAAAETRLSEAGAALRAGERESASARETLIRAEAALEQAATRLAELHDHIEERLDCDPDAILETAGIEADADMPDSETLAARLRRMLAERDRMGPVNLRADQEAGDLGDQIAGMERERDDLLAAIRRLRGAVGALNREGRARLTDAFGRINTHFETLFAKLFEGGRGTLRLIEAGEDPLDVGLEVIARLPGKRPQIMSLLSGGEQALTAIALVFAAFLTNPAPICVLDEVDAPLDDANVDRFCRLLDEICRATGTRFLIITHHRMTMARMDRLFGVTMAERGVSRLVSVDLGAAERLRESA